MVSAHNFQYDTSFEPSPFRPKLRASRTQHVAAPASRGSQKAYTLLQLLHKLLPLSQWCRFLWVVTKVSPRRGHIWTRLRVHSIFASPRLCAPFRTALVEPNFRELAKRCAHRNWGGGTTSGALLQRSHLVTLTLTLGLAPVVRGGSSDICCQTNDLIFLRFCSWV